MRTNQKRFMTGKGVSMILRDFQKGELAGLTSPHAGPEGAGAQMRLHLQPKGSRLSLS
jgi:hypothetical protein